MVKRIECLVSPAARLEQVKIRNLRRLPHTPVIRTKYTIRAPLFIRPQVPRRMVVVERQLETNLGKVRVRIQQEICQSSRMELLDILARAYIRDHHHLLPERLHLDPLLLLDYRVPSRRANHRVDRDLAPGSLSVESQKRYEGRAVVELEHPQKRSRFDHLFLPDEILPPTFRPADLPRSKGLEEDVVSHEGGRQL